jgi:hypothetical protein
MRKYTKVIEKNISKYKNSLTNFLDENYSKLSLL